jgi:hypothetical protein
MTGFDTRCFRRGSLLGPFYQLEGRAVNQSSGSQEVMTCPALRGMRSRELSIIRQQGRATKLKALPLPKKLIVIGCED